MELRQRTASLTIAVFLIFTGGCGDGSGTSLAEGGRFQLTAPASQVAASTDPYIVVTAKVNGVPGRFLVDTGADSFIVSQEFAQRTGLALIGTTTVGTIVGSTTTDLRRIDRFELGALVGEEIPAAVLDLHDFDGAVGMPMFRETVVTLDFENQLLSIASPELADTIFSEPGLEILDAAEFVLPEVVINGVITRDVLVDTGNGGGLLLAGEEANEIASSVEATVPTVVNASNGSAPAHAFIAESLQLGPIMLPEQFAVVLHPEFLGGGHPVVERNLLGNLVLKQFYVVLDVGGGRIGLRQEKVIRFKLSPDAAPMAGGRAEARTEYKGQR